MRRKRWSKKNAIGRSKGGVTTKIHAIANDDGKPVRFLLTPGQVHDSTMYEDLVADLDFDVFIGDKAYDADRILKDLEDRNAQAVIPSTKSRKEHREISKALYGFRYLIECMFHDLKRFRRVATRYEKRAFTYVGMISLACALICLA
jgi:transposase